MDILIVPDPHAHPKHDNNRATLAGKLMADVKPVYVINMGDTADMPSLCSYERGTKAFEGRRYNQDIASAVEFNDKLFAPYKQLKKKMPRRVILIGNHEQRIPKALSLDPVLEGTIGLKDLEYEKYYDDVVEYDGSTPGQINVEGIEFSHFMVSGILGRPISSEHLGYTLLTKKFGSCVIGHTHTLDYSIRVKGDGNFIHGLASGCFIDYKTDWAGKAEDYWWKGLILLKNVNNGSFDLETISIERLRKEYS
jgi:hypothetical protein